MHEDDEFQSDIQEVARRFKILTEVSIELLNMSDDLIQFVMACRNCEVCTLQGSGYCTEHVSASTIVDEQFNKLSQVKAELSR